MRSAACLSLFLVALATANADQSEMTLPQATTIALANRPTIQAATEKVRAAEAKEREAGANGPLRLETGYGTRPDLGIGNDLFLAAPLDVFGKAAAQRAIAHAEVLNAKAALIQSALDLQSDVFTAYSELESAQVLQDSGDRLVELAQQVYKATQDRISAGDLPPNQLLRAGLELKKAQQTQKTRQHTLESAKSHFEAILGGAAPSTLPLSASIPDPPPSPPIEERPDIAAAKASIAGARADMGAARKSAMPDVELQVARDYWDNPGRFVGRVQVIWNFFDFGASGNHHSAAEHTAKSSILTLKDLIAQATDQVRTSRTDFDSGREEIEGFTTLVHDAQELLAKEKQAFVAGASSLLDVIDASRSLREVEESVADSRSRTLVAESKYLAATGTLIGALPPEKASR